MDLNYKLKLVELLMDQSPVDAINQSEGIFEIEALKETSFILPVGSIDLIDKNSYAWTVYVTLGNEPLISSPYETQNIGIFQYHDDISITNNFQALEIIQPVSDTLKSENTIFTWKGIDGQDVFYNLILDVKNDVTTDISQLTVESDVTIDLNTPFFISDDIYEPMVEINLSNIDFPSNNLVAQIQVFYSDGTSEKGPEKEFNYREATESDRGCDTTEVNEHIDLTLDKIKGDLCDKKPELLDSLVNAFKNYENLLWKKDSIAGMIETSVNFKKRLNDLKKSALNELESEINEANNLNSNNQNCYPNWKQQFYNRYVSGKGGNQNTYQRYVNKYENRFNRCKTSNKNRLQRKHDDISQKYDDKIQNLDNILQNLNNQQKVIENEINQSQNKLNNLKQQLIDNLCSLNIQWSQLIQYMLQNIICVDCKEGYIVKPPEIVGMDSCLINIFNNLANLGFNLKTSKPKDDLNAEANSFFDLEELDKTLKTINDLKNKFKQIIAQTNQNGILRVAHPCCEGFAELATGKYIYLRQEKMALHQSAYGDDYGLGATGVILLPADPSTFASSKSAKRNYQKAKKEFRSQRVKLNREMDRALRKLRNSYSTQTKSGMHINPSIERGLCDENVINKHGAVAAEKHHNASKLKLINELNDLLNELEKCLSPAQQQNFHNTHIGC